MGVELNVRLRHGTRLNPHTANAGMVGCFLAKSANTTRGAWWRTAVSERALIATAGRAELIFQVSRC